MFATFNHSKTVHITRFINRNDASSAHPWATGLGADNLNGIATLTTVESSAKSKYDAFTVGMNKRYAQNYQFQWNYTIGATCPTTTTSATRSRCAMRGPTTSRRKYSTATSGTASTPGCW